MIINMIAAADAVSGGIGKDGAIPWRNKEDMAWFRRHTVGHAVIMGWKTFVSLGNPLKDRLNIVLTTTHDAEGYYECADGNVRTARTLDESIEIARAAKHDTVYVIGGASVYKAFLEADYVDTLYINKVRNEQEYVYDTFFPYDAMNGYDVDDCPLTISSRPWLWIEPSECGNGCNDFHIAHRMRQPTSTDAEYLDLLRHIIDDGVIKDTRAGETLSTFGNMLRFNMKDGLPVLTTKKMFMKGCIEELLWFLRGETNIRTLVEKGVHIWDGDAYRWYLEEVRKFNGLNRLFGDGEMKPLSQEEFIIGVMKGKTLQEYTFGDLGPVYGRQWRNWGGHDQIAKVIRSLRENPDDRRLIVSAWNVSDVDSMALPPCHYSFQFYTRKLRHRERLVLYRQRMGTSGIAMDGDRDENDEAMLAAMKIAGIPERGISLMWNQRSVDTCLGLPYNIMSYGLLLSMIGQVVNMMPDELICSLGDTHVYQNQLEQAKLQLERNPFKFRSPKLFLNPAIRDIYEFKSEDISVLGYESYPGIKFELSVGLDGKNEETRERQEKKDDPFMVKANGNGMLEMTLQMNDAEIPENK